MDSKLKKIVLRIMVCLCIGLIISTCTIFVAYGWFTSVWSSMGDVVKFTAGTTEDPEFAFWTYLTSEEATIQGGEATAGWKQQTDTTVSSVNKTVNSNVYTFNLSSLHFGTMDNLVSIKDDNRVYIRFKIEPEKQGQDIKLTAGYYTEDDNNYIQLYDKDGTDVTTDTVTLEDDSTTTVAAQLKELCAEYPFLDFDYAISTTAYTPGTTGFNALEFNTITYTDGDDEYPGEFLKTSSSVYYLYVRIQPDLISFRRVTSYVNNYMPCIMLFDIELTLTSYKYEEVEEVITGE